MMKKNAITYVIIFIMVCTMIVLISRNNTLEESKLNIEEMLSSSESEVEKLNDLTTEYADAIETISSLNNQIDDYEFVINKWADYDIYYDIRSDLAKKSYDIEAIVHTADRSFPLPKNGKIVVDSDFVELEINIVRPPTLIDDDINEIIHQHDNITDDLKYDSYDSTAEYFADDDTITLKYSALEYGDKIDIYVYDDLYHLLGLIDSNIQINVTNEFSNAKEYFPTDIKKKVFSGGYKERGFIHNFNYNSDDSWTVDFNDGIGDVVFKFENNDAVKSRYEYDEAVKVTAISWDGDNFVPFERIILPKEIKLGESWADQSRIATITAVDFPIETVFGVLDTVEVTYSIDEREQIIYHYAKGFGIVHRNVFRSEGILTEIEYYK